MQMADLQNAPIFIGAISQCIGSSPNTMTAGGGSSR